MSREEVGVGLPVMKGHGNLSDSLSPIDNQKSVMLASQLINSFHGKNTSIDMGHMTDDDSSYRRGDEKLGHLVF